MLIFMTLISSLLLTFSSTSTIDNANYATFVMDLNEVEYKIMEESAILRGTEGAKGVTRTATQAYNYVAKGANATDTDEKAWIPNKMSEALSATHISPNTVEEALGISLPIIEVNTQNNKGIQASYFVTNGGILFIWPPFEYNNGKEDVLYVTANQYLCEESGDGIYVVGQGNPVSYDDIDLEDIKGIILEEEKYDYAAGKYVAYDNVTVLIDSEHAEPQISINSITDASVLEKTPAVYYKDTSNAKSPVGLETNEMYNGK